MPGSTPATSQLDWLSSTTAMIVLSWSKATRDLLKSFSWGIGALRQLFASDDGAISFAACPIPSMDVTYTLDPGPVLRFGPPSIVGLERLSPAYVEGRVRWQRGEVYDASKVDETRRALIETGLFSTVQITPTTDPEHP